METEQEWIKRTRHTVTKGKRDLVAEFEEKNKDRIDKAVKLMKNEQASNHEVMRQCSNHERAGGRRWGNGHSML